MEPNQSSGILLYEDRFSVSYLDRSQDCRCRVTFDLTRKRHVLIDCLESLYDLVAGVHSPVFHREEPFRIFLPGSTRPIECHIYGSFRQQIMGDDPSVFLTFEPFGNGAFLDRGSQLSKIDGGIVNFNQYRVGAKQTIRLNDGTWNLELTPIEETDAYPPHIQSSSYLFTHHLRLQRIDAQTFSWSQAQTTLEMLSTFLSFCAEHWVAPALLKGYDQLGEVAVQDWRSTRLDPRERRGNWLDEHYGDAMGEAFPGFAHLMEDQEWQEAIRSAVY